MKKVNEHYTPKLIKTGKEKTEEKSAVKPRNPDKKPKVKPPEPT